MFSKILPDGGKYSQNNQRGPFDQDLLDIYRFISELHKRVCLNSRSTIL